MLKKYYKYLVIGLVIGIASTLMLPRKGKSALQRRDMAEITKEGILRVTTEYGNNSYHINDSGEVEGLHYQLIRQFADEHNLELEVIPAMEIEEQNRLLYEGKCDVIACSRLLNAEPDSNLCYTNPVTVDKLLIIQRKPETNDSLCPYLSTTLDLAGKTLSIPAGSSFKYRIKHLIEEIGDTIYIEEVPQYGSEQLLALVAHGDRCYAVCEENSIHAYIDQYPQLDNQLAVSFNQFYSWVLHARSTVLKDSLNQWLYRKGFNFR